jgi:hypothetical protein
MTKPLELNYCPCCSHALIDKFLVGRVRRKCPDCGFIFFRDPKVAAGVLAEQDGKVLPVKRLFAPQDLPKNLAFASTRQALHRWLRSKKPDF